MKLTDGNHVLEFRIGLHPETDPRSDHDSSRRNNQLKETESCGPMEDEAYIKSWIISCGIAFYLTGHISFFDLEVWESDFLEGQRVDFPRGPLVPYLIRCVTV